MAQWNYRLRKITKPPYALQKKKKNAILLFYSLQNEKHPPFFPYSLIVFFTVPN